MLAPSTDLVICPVQALQLYTTVLNHISGHLFLFLSGHPATHSIVTQQLKLTLAICILNPTQYKCHSFRIRAATEAAKLGYSENWVGGILRLLSAIFALIHSVCNRCNFSTSPTSN